MTDVPEEDMRAALVREVELTAHLEAELGRQRLKVQRLEAEIVGKPFDAQAEVDRAIGVPQIRVVAYEQHVFVEAYADVALPPGPQGRERAWAKRYHAERRVHEPGAFLRLLGVTLEARIQVAIEDVRREVEAQCERHRRLLRVEELWS